MRVMVAMSGGVDSSVAAALAVEAGHEVFGVTMKVRNASPTESQNKGSCCSPDDLMDARQVCDTLGIPHYSVDYREVFYREVIQPFAEAYRQGKTPNPCVNCNNHVKFVPLVERARALGAEVLVTGHYARTSTEGGEAFLHRALDTKKDQSYFLYGVTQDALRMTWFPLGEMTKTEVRQKAKDLGLPTWNKEDSEDICFVPEGNYVPVIEKVLGSVPGAGNILNKGGQVVGTHQGIHHFTVGQRKGLGVSSNSKLYVLGVDSETSTVTVGEEADLYHTDLHATDFRWISGTCPNRNFEAIAHLRHGHPGSPVQVNVALDGSVHMAFLKPERIVAPGQSVVLYQGSKVLGGGVIS